MLHKTAATVSREIELHAEAAINAYLVTFAQECGFVLDVEEDMDNDGAPVYYLSPSQEDCVYAARQQLTIASVLSDLCGHMGITPPRAITAALSDEPLT